MHTVDNKGQIKESIVFFQGAVGAQGASGAQGPSGATGPQGATGSQGPTGTGGSSSDLGCRVTHNANQTVSNNSNFTMAFNSESYDTDTMHDNSTNNSRITIKTAGKYWVWGNIAWTSNATGVRVIKFWVNGDSSQQWGFEAINTVSGNTFYQVSGFEKEFAVNDYIECIVVQTSGGNLTCNNEDVKPMFGARRMY